MYTHPFRKKIRRWFWAGGMFFCSLSLLTVGVPRFLHELMLVPGTPILHRLNTGEQVSDEDLSILEQSRLDALDFIELPDAYTDLGASYLTRARRARTDEDRRKFAEMTIEVSTSGLNMAPLNTFAWMRVATAHIIVGPEHYDDALEAWRTSIATARFEPLLLMQRVHLGTILYQVMNPEDIEKLRDQLGLAYEWNRRDARRYAEQYSLLDWIVLLSDPLSEQGKFFVNANRK